MLEWVGYGVFGCAGLGLCGAWVYGVAVGEGGDNEGRAGEAATGAVGDGDCVCVGRSERSGNHVFHAVLSSLLGARRW